jgi:hypothetical protein
MSLEEQLQTVDAAKDGPRMPTSSRYAGRPIDISSRHSIRIDSPTSDPSISAGDDKAVIDFLYHDQRYWRAVVPLDGVDQIYGQAFNFSKPKTRKTQNGREFVTDEQGIPKRTIPILNHLQCRAKFRPDCPIELYPLGGSAGERTTGGEDGPLKLHDIVYSFEACGPVGVSFNLRDAFCGNLISTHRILSTEAMVFERLVVENQYIGETPPLLLTDQQKRELLVGALVRSHSAGMDEAYYLYRLFGTNNCTSSPFQLLDQVAHYGFWHRIGSLLYRLPLSPRFYLRVRGMDPDSSSRKLLRSEFEDYIQDEQTQQRKREYVRQQTARQREAREQA